MPGYDSYVKSLLHFDGSDGGIVFTDETGKSWTRTSNPTTITGNKKFGTASGNFTAASYCRIVTPHTSDFDFEGNDFTVDFWMYPTNVDTAASLNWKTLVHFVGNTYLNEIRFRIEGATPKMVLAGSRNSSGFLNITGTTTIVVNTWQHIALVYTASNTTFTLYVNGVNDGTHISAFSAPVLDYLVIGSYLYAYDATWQKSYIGQVDEFRVSKGIARWTGNFTPPTYAYDVGTEYPISINESVITTDVVNAIISWWPTTAEDAFAIEEIAPIVIDPFLLDDGCGFIDLNSGGFQAFESVEDILEIYSWTSWGDKFEESILDSISITEYISYLSAQILSIADTFVIWDTPKIGWVLLIADVLVIVDTINKIAGIPVSDSFNFIEGVIGNWNGSEVVIDSFFISELIECIKVIYDALLDELSIADIGITILILQIIEYITLTEAIPLTQMLNIDEVINTIDSLSKSFDPIIADVLATEDAGVARWLGTIQSLDTLTIVDSAPINTLTIKMTVAESLTTSDVASSQGNLFSVILEALRMELELSLDGDVWQCWVVTNPAFDISVYSNFDFNSYCFYQGGSYGVKSDGLYKLETDTTDNGSEVHSGLVLTASNFGTEHRKKFRRASLGISGSGAAIRVQTDEGEDKIFRVINRKAYIDKDVLGKDFTLSLSDFDSLDFIELVPLVLAQ